MSGQDKNTFNVGDLVRVRGTYFGKVRAVVEFYGEYSYKIEGIEDWQPEIVLAKARRVSERKTR